MIDFKEVKKSDLISIIKLTMNRGQKNLVASNSISISQVHY